MVSKLKAICPLDGRYNRRTDGLAEKLGRKSLSSVDEEECVNALSECSSEYALIRNRVRIELDYLLALDNWKLVGLSDDKKKSIDELYDVSEIDAQFIKDIEVKGVEGINNGKKTNHDVKAVEYYIRNRLGKNGVSLEKLAMIHFAITSEDVDNIANNLMIQDSINVLLSSFRNPENIHKKDVSILTAQFAKLEKIRLTGKFGGAIGNLSAHRAAYPALDWQVFAKEFVESYNFVYNPLTTQIEPSDTVNHIFQELIGVNDALFDIVENTSNWKDISDLTGISTALAGEFSRKQPISRRQRDLSGSAVRRNYGTAFAFTLLALEQCYAPRMQNASSLKTDVIKTTVLTASQSALDGLDKVIIKLVDMADKYKAAVMLGKTHGQPVIPTTLGKEFAVFAYRLYTQRCELVDCHNKKDAVGVLQAFNRVNTILVGFAQDVWQYISDEYIVQKPVEGEVGSSTMAQKVNPIDFENGEGNLLVANALFDFFTRRVNNPTTVIAENISMPLGYSIVAYNGLIAGMEKIVGNTEHMLAIVKNHWEVLAEPIQTILRTKGIADAYEAIKDLTRGKRITQETITEFVAQSTFDDETRKQILNLRPETYIGYAVELTEKYMDTIRKSLCR